MPRTTEQILQEQLGQLTFNIAVLGARLEKALDELEKLRAEKVAAKALEKEVE